MVRRRADERQSQRDVDGVLERDRLDRDQRLVVIHADGAVVGLAGRCVEHGIRRQGAPGVDAFRAQRLNGGCDDVDVFAAERAVFAGMRVEARYRKPRPGQAEMRPEIRDRNPCRRHDQLARELGQRLAQRKVDGDGNDGERRRPQHHHRLRRAAAIGGKLGEKFGVAGMAESRAVQHALGDRVGDDGASSTAPYMVDGLANGGQRGGRAGVVGLSGARGGDFARRHHGQRFRECRARFLRDGIGKLDLQSQDFRSLREERAVAEQIERRKVQLFAPQPGCEGNVGADARGLAGCQRESLGLQNLSVQNLGIRRLGHQSLAINDIRSSRLCGGRSDRLSVSPRISGRTSFPGFPASSACRSWSVSGRTMPPSPRPVS